MNGQETKSVRDPRQQFVIMMEYFQPTAKKCARCNAGADPGDSCQTYIVLTSVFDEKWVYLRDIDYMLEGMLRMGFRL